MEIHTAEPLESQPGFSEFDIAIAKLKQYKLPGTDHIWAEQEVKHYVLRSITH
jgi:hypothetical protein